MERSKVTSSIQRGAAYFYTKLGAVVRPIEQVAVVNGLPMWEAEQTAGSGWRNGLNALHW